MGGQTRVGYAWVRLGQHSLRWLPLVPQLTLYAALAPAATLLLPPFLCSAVLRTVAGVLHLGNVDFAMNSRRGRQPPACRCCVPTGDARLPLAAPLNLWSKRPCKCRDEAQVAGADSVAALEAAARLLGVSDVGLEAALTTRAIDARGERIVKRLDAGVWARASRCPFLLLP